MEYRVVKAESEELKNKAFDIREEVFIIEQKVAKEEEFDEFEKDSHHFVALDSSQRPIGASRWRRTEKGVKLERFAVKASARGQGIGGAIVKATLDDIASSVGPGTYLYMHSQLEAVSLYEKFGFQKKGDLFEECKMPHYFMWKHI